MLKPFKDVSYPASVGLRLRCIIKRLFCFCNYNRQSALADGLHGLNSINTAHRYTPVQKATSVDLATGEAIGTTVEQGQSYKRTNPSCALGAFFVLEHIKSGEGRLEVASIHPWRSIV